MNSDKFPIELVSALNSTIASLQSTAAILTSIIAEQAETIDAYEYTIESNRCVIDSLRSRGVEAECKPAGLDVLNLMAVMKRNEGRA